VVVVLVMCGWHDGVFKVITSGLELHFKEVCGGICPELLARCANVTWVVKCGWFLL